jgi:hypothetical protein
LVTYYDDLSDNQTPPEEMKLQKLNEYCNFVDIITKKLWKSFKPLQAGSNKPSFSRQIQKHLMTNYKLSQRGKLNQPFCRQIESLTISTVTGVLQAI